MNLGRLIQFVGLMTVVALTHIFMQMRIIDLAYQNQRQQERYRQLLEEHGYRTYLISRLKSANYLGEKVLADHSDLHFADADHVVQVAADFSKKPTAIVSVRPESRRISFLGLFVSESEAEARTFSRPSF